MPPIRPFLVIFGVPLLLTLAFAGCSGDDDSGANPAAQPAAAAAASSFQVMSPAFTNIRPRIPIPHKYTCMQEDVSPPLTWSGTPPGTKSLALIADDPEHRTGLWVHWVLYNIPPDVTELPEGMPTGTAVLPDGTTQGTNHNKNIGYNGPCPADELPRRRAGAEGGYPNTGGMPPHKYYFRLYALDSEVGVGPGATMDELVNAMDGHILAQADWVGKYTRPMQQMWFTSDSGSPIPNTPTPVGNP